jgi:uncharacterized damage-inducible protein DinB
LGLIKWTERKFNFDFPASLFPVVVARLQGTVPRIEAIVASTSPKKLTEKKDGKWSIQEHIGHLVDLEDLHLGRIEDFRNSVNPLRAADMSNAATVKADHNKRSIEEILKDLKRTRAHFVEELRTFSGEELEKTSLHPRLQKQMRVVDMAFFVAEHDDHHIALMLAI